MTYKEATGVSEWNIAYGLCSLSIRSELFCDLAAQVVQSSIGLLFC
jgi:hypothetical protein